MKKLVLVVLTMVAFGANRSNAQSTYTAAAGLGLNLFSGATLVGPSAKLFLEENHVIQGEIMFETNLTVITALYEYHENISGAGPSILFLGNGFGTEIALRSIAGLDYKINGVPLAFSFDWRPFIGLGDLSNEVRAFGLGIRYVIK